jgi:hypothetical protein
MPLTQEQVREALSGGYADKRWMFDELAGLTWTDAAPAPTEEELAAVLERLWRDRFWADAKAQREVFLNRLSGIAGRMQRQQPEGWLLLVQAADNFAQGLLDLPAHPSLQPNVTPTLDSLKLAFKTHYASLVSAAITTAPGSKAIWDNLAK